jgi:hypothetical protein
MNLIPFSTIYIILLLLLRQREIENEEGKNDRSGTKKSQVRGHPRTWKVERKK